TNRTGTPGRSARTGRRSRASEPCSTETGSDDVIQILLVILLLPVCCVAPGLRPLRSLDLRPLERLVAAVALSLVFIYLGTFALFAMSLGARWYSSVLLVLIGLALAGA